MRAIDQRRSMIAHVAYPDQIASDDEDHTCSDHAERRQQVASLRLRQHLLLQVTIRHAVRSNRLSLAGLIQTPQSFSRHLINIARSSPRRSCQSRGVCTSSARRARYSAQGAFGAPKRTAPARGDARYALLGEADPSGALLAFGA